MIPFVLFIFLFILSFIFSFKVNRLLKRGTKTCCSRSSAITMASQLQSRGGRPLPAHPNTPEPTSATCAPELGEQTTGAMTTLVPFKCMKSFILFSMNTTKRHRSRTKKAEVTWQDVGRTGNSSALRHTVTPVTVSKENLAAAPTTTTTTTLANRAALWAGLTVIQWCRTVLRVRK